MPQVIYLGFSALLEHTRMTLSALQQAPEESGALTLEAHSVSQLEILINWLQQESKPEAILIWPKPTSFIADCLSRDEAIDSSLIQWRNMAEELLKLFRHHRSQLTLLGMAPGEAFALTDELPADIANIINQIEVSVKCLPQATPLYRLAAAQLAAEDAELQEVWAFLTASSHACSAPGEKTSETVRSALQSASESHHAKQQLNILAQERDSASEENKLLLIQLHGVQESLEAAEQKVVEYQKQAQQQVNNAIPEQQFKKISDERDSAREENELLLTQLHIVQEALEEAYLERQARPSNKEIKTQQESLEKLKRLVVWLRAHARRHARTAYNGSESKTLQSQIKLLEQSDLFDANWYLEQYKDVAKAKMNPAEHFIKFGAIEGRNPSTLFNTEFYLLNYPDITSSGLHPLLHYLSDGIKEQRKTQGSPK